MRRQKNARNGCWSSLAGFLDCLSIRGYWEVLLNICEVTIVLRIQGLLDTFPVAPELPKELKNLIAKLGELWVKCPKRPQPKRDVRKHSNDRGAVLRHVSGRSFVPTDNSPAKWAFVQSYRGCKPSLKEVTTKVKKNRIPIAMALKRRERAKTHYTYLLNEFERQNPNSAGWKLAHIESVGLNYRRNLAELDISTLKKHFVKLMTPSNMFVVPKKYGGLAELPEFCEQLKHTDNPSRLVCQGD